MTKAKIQTSAPDASRPADRNHVPDPTQDRLLTEAEVARRQSRSVKTLQNQRVNGDGIPFLKLGRSVRYRLSDVVAWEQSNFRISTSDLGTPNPDREA